MENCNEDDNEMIACAVACMEAEGILYKPGGKPNIPELMRRTGLSRQRARTLARKGFKRTTHGNKGKTHPKAIDEKTGLELDSLLAEGVTNSAVLYRVAKEKCGYQGSVSSIKRHREAHSFLIPSPRQAVATQGTRVRRYETEPGHMFQMDWGFVNVICVDGSIVKAAVFAMVCHHCGMVYMEFFPNSRQENLFIGMVHAFIYMGMPDVVLTDNMASVSNRRGSDGKPIMNSSYAAFQKACGFETKLCKPRHPFTKGKVERLVKFIKDNFVPAREFTNITDLNEQAIRWCDDWNRSFHRATGVVPQTEHDRELLVRIEGNPGYREVFMPYMAPLRRISIDGFVTYEGRRYGVPFAYAGREARVMRDKEDLVVLDSSCSYTVCRHKVDWSLKPHYCEGQFEDQGPEELPTAPVKVQIGQMEPHVPLALFSRFDFREE